jgi:RND superfamily putative drug exporter
VVLGLQRSGRIITAAAALLAIVFAAFVSSGVTNIKQLGLGVAFAILLDATVVRGLLVPAIMRLFGAANWWAPRPLRAVHARFGLSEGGAAPAAMPSPRSPEPADEQEALV